MQEYTKDSYSAKGQYMMVKDAKKKGDRRPEEERRHMKTKETMHK